MDPDLEIPSRIQDPSLKPLQPLYVDSWASLHVNIPERTLRIFWSYRPMYQKFGSCVPEKLISDKNVYCMVNVLCGTYAEKESSYLLSLIYMTTESDSSVIEQWARYPEVAGSIPAQIQLFKNFQISWPRPVQSIQSVQSSQSSQV